MAARLEHVRSYYESLNTGDADAVAAHFTDDAVHYYTRRAPDRGREIAERAVWAVENIEAEWSMAFDHPRDGRRLLDRGAEFLAFRDGLICEVRAYYNERGGDLQGFDHAARGHTTLTG